MLVLVLVLMQRPCSASWQLMPGILCSPVVAQEAVIITRNIYL